MLPVIASVNSFNYQTPLVNTTTPGTGVVHVPYDNVAPSISSAQADNNSNSNNIINTPSQEQQAAGAAADDSSSGGSPSPAQSAFVAQLAAQDNSPQTQVILVQYEKLVATGNVKYKPSEALKPQDEALSSAFSRILNENSSAPAPVQQAAPKTNPAPITTDNAQVTIEATTSLPGESNSSESSDSQTSDTEAAGTDTNAASFDAIPPHVIAAYASTASRISSLSAPSAEIA